MRFLVTGATGFVGSHVARELLDSGHEVTSYARPSSDPSLLPPECRRLTGDLFSIDELTRAMKGCDGVFHVAGNTSWWRPDRETVWKVNVEATRAVREALKRAEVRRGVLTSSVAAVGVTDDPARPADEDTPFNWPDALRYPASKREAEAIWLRTDDGIEGLTVNPATIFGPGDGRMGVGVLFRRIQEGRFPRLWRGGLSVVDVRDVARGHRLAFERGVPGERYILAGENLESGRIGDEIARGLGAELPRKKAGPAALFLLRTLAAGVERLGGRLDAAAGHLWIMPRYVYHSAQKARAKLGFTSRPFAETVRDSVSWYREKGLLP